MTSLPQMTCDECRQIIAVADLTDWGDMDAVASHCRTCDACAGVVTEVRDSARRVAELLDGIGPGVSSSLVARRAAAAAAIERQQRRRRRTIVYPLAATVAAAAVLASVAVVRGGGRRTEVRRVVLQCLAPEQGAALVMPILGRAGGVAVPGESPMRELTLTGPRRLVNEAERVLAKLDDPGESPGGSCASPDPGMQAERAAMEQEMVNAQQEAERARQEVERARQEAERARQEAERARQDALAHRP